MLQNILNLEGVNKLKKEDQKQISGGSPQLAGADTYTCTCGFNGEGPVHTIEGGTLIDALQSMGRACNGAGAQCQGQ